MTKENLLLTGSISLLIIVALAVVDANFGGKACVYYPEFGQSIEYCELLAFFISPLLLFIPFSLIFFFLKEEVFQAWWRFARWFVPIIMVVTFLLNRSEQGGMGISGAVSRSFDFLVISIFYVIFIVVSLTRIALAYRRTR